MWKIWRHHTQNRQGLWNVDGYGIGTGPPHRYGATTNSRECVLFDGERLKRQIILGWCRCGCVSVAMCVCNVCYGSNDKRRTTMTKATTISHPYSHRMNSYRPVSIFIILHLFYYHYYYYVVLYRQYPRWIRLNVRPLTMIRTVNDDKWQ